MRKSLINIIILVIMLFLLIISSGCNRYSKLSITSQEFKMVNEYTKESGAEEISLKDVTSMDPTIVSTIYKDLNEYFLLSFML